MAGTGPPQASRPYTEHEEKNALVRSRRKAVNGTRGAPRRAGGVVAEEQKSEGRPAGDSLARSQDGRRRGGRDPLVDERTGRAARRSRRSTSSTTPARSPPTRSSTTRWSSTRPPTTRSPSTCCTASPTALTDDVKNGAPHRAHDLGPPGASCPTSRSPPSSSEIAPHHRRLDVRELERVPRVVPGRGRGLHRARRSGAPARRRSHEGQDVARRQGQGASSSSSPTTSAT